MNSISKVVSPLGRLVKAGAIGGVGLAIYRAIRGPQRPPVTGQANWPPLVEPTPKPKRTAPLGFAADPGSASGTDNGSSPDPASPVPAGQLWAAPIDGQCPEGYPVKGNAQSGIFHVPGGMSYEVTIPERCYKSAEDATTDGFRKSKR